MTRTLVMLAVVLSATPAPAQRMRPNARDAFVSVADFGASGADERWDSDAIQRAIDSLPKNGPDSENPAGGVVVFPAGKYMLNRPLRIFSGVTLRGEGSGSTLHAFGDQPAIVITSPFPHHYCVRATVEELSIRTESGPAITVAPDVTNIVQSQFQDLVISAGGCAIDLDPGIQRKIGSQNTVVRNIQIYRYGGPALTIFGNANHIERVTTDNGTRPKFRAEPAIMTIAGENNDIRSCIIGSNQPDTSAVAFCVSGSFTWAHNWIEMNPKQNNVVYIFKDVDSAQIDYLHYLIPQHRAKFINCQSVLIRSVTIEGTLQDCIELDDQSHVRFDVVSTRFDAGMLDDPRVSIGALYCRPARTRIELPLGKPVVKLLPAANARGAGNWDARWDTEQGVIRGSMRIEETGAARQMRVEVTENARRRPLLIEIPLPDHEDLLGKRCIVTWRIDGPGEAFVDHNDKQFPSRVRNSLTANVLPTPLKSGDKLMFWLPPEPGVYHVSQVALYAP